MMSLPRFLAALCFALWSMLCCLAPARAQGTAILVRQPCVISQEISTVSMSTGSDWWSHFPIAQAKDEHFFIDETNQTHSPRYPAAFECSYTGQGQEQGNVGGDDGVADTVAQSFFFGPYTGSAHQPFLGETGAVRSIS